MEDIAELLSRFPNQGRVEWIGVRPGRRQPLRGLEQVRAVAGRGLDGDHYEGRSGVRAVTLIQAEHLTVIGSLLGGPAVEPARLRRNLVVSGINLVALKGRRFRIGEVTLEGTGSCDPCSRMEEVLGPGGLNLMRGHGGLTARVIAGGTIRVGDPVAVLPDADRAATRP